MIPSLNWKEISLLVDQIRPQVEGCFIDRIIIPERKKFSATYLKNEWVLRLTSRTSESSLLVSLKPRQCYLSWSPGKGPAASTAATHSAFDLALSKNLKGAKILSIDTLPAERVIVLKFKHPTEDAALGLVLVLIPAAPDGYLVSLPSQNSKNALGWPILAQNRSPQKSFFLPPEPSKNSSELSIRENLVQPVENFHRLIEKELDALAFDSRIQAAQKLIKAQLKNAQDRFRQSQTAAQEAQKEPNWQYYGDLLKGSIGSPCELTGNYRQVTDYATETQVRVPCDPKLNFKDQIEKFYHQAKRKIRRLQEATERMQNFEATATALEQALNQAPLFPNWSALTQWEQKAGIHVKDQGLTKRTTSSKSGWTGKSFLSKDGLPIWVGRSRDENLELTFKFARGNDLWLHLRGRPGAHVVIPLSPGKSAPLETLLDAAALTLQYSGGSGWGTTEVDYTYRKYVKRIKDSKEVSYTSNKTLLVKPDPIRIQRLVGGAGTP